MKVKIDAILKTFDGVTIKDGEEILNLKRACTNALLANPQEEIEGTEKLLRYELAKKIHRAKEEIDLTSEEVAKIKGLAGKVYAPLIVGQIYELLEK